MALRWSALGMWCFFYRHIAPLEQSGQQNIYTPCVNRTICGRFSNHLYTLHRRGPETSPAKSEGLSLAQCGYMKFQKIFR